jgi:hypothetical protein
MRMTESRRSPVVRLKLHIEATNFRGGTPRSFGSTNARELNCASIPPISTCNPATDMGTRTSRGRCK